jgi:hypothetical protein
MEDICHQRELEIFFQKKELENIVSHIETFEKSLVVLEDILNVQISSFDRTGLGYNNI